MPGKLNVEALASLTDEQIAILREPMWWEFCGNEGEWNVVGPFETRDEALRDHDAAAVKGDCKKDHGLWFCSVLNMLDKGMKTPVIPVEHYHSTNVKYKIIRNALSNYFNVRSKVAKKELEYV